MAFCYENCSNLLWEKNVKIIKKNIYKSKAEGENVQKFWDHYVEQFIWTVNGQTVFETEHYFYLLMPNGGFYESTSTWIGTIKSVN